MSSKLGGSDCHTYTTTSGSRASITLMVHSSPGVLWQNDEFILAIEGCPRWANQLPSDGSPEDVAMFFTAAYRQKGAKALDHLHGHFAIALVRKDGTEALIATDRVGSKPAKYSLVDDTLVFGSSADTINAMLPTKRPVDPQALFNYVYFDMVPAPRTAFQDIERLMAGQYLLFRNGRVNADVYWTADYHHADRRPRRELEEELLNLLEASVGAALTGTNPGAFLSGGIDSSTITGMICRTTGKPARTYSIGFDVPGYDEMKYARTTASYFGTDHHEYYVTPKDVLATAPQIAAAYDAPFGNASAVPSLYCAQLAKNDNVDQLLGGDGGDELFGGNSRYAKQWIFSLYDSIPPLVRRGLIEPAVSSALTRHVFPRKLKSYIHQASTPMPDRMQSYNLLARLGPQFIFTEDFLASVDPLQPLELISETYNGAKADNLIERMLAVDLRFTLADNDLPKVTRMCDLAGVGVSFPFLDDRLLSFSQRLPADLKVKRTHLRYFFRKAIKKFLPPEIITKKKHGFGLPFGVWLKSDPSLQTLVADTLASLKCRDIVRRGFIDELESDRLNEHAAYYGTMVWTLLILELWLQAHAG